MSWGKNTNIVSLAFYQKLTLKLAYNWVFSPLSIYTL